MSTRDRLLKQATRLFAQKGYDGAATEEIVRAARVTKRMLYHYFESKEGLYRAALEAQFVGLREAVGQIDMRGGGDLLSQVVDVSFDYLAAHPELVRLTMWEGLRGGDTSRSLWSTTRGPLFAQAAVLLQALAPRFDGKQLLISLLGAATFYFAFSHTLGDALQMDPLTPKALKARKAHLHALLKPLFTP